jgi:hypothetical protein
MTSPTFPAGSGPGQRARPEAVSPRIVDACKSGSISLPDSFRVGRHLGVVLARVGMALSSYGEVR